MKKNEKTPVRDNQGYGPSLEVLLSKDPNSFGSAALQNAAKEFQEKKAKAEAEKALRVLEEGNNRLQKQIASLRIIRAQEKIAHDRLKKYNAAFNKFQKDGDFAAFNAVNVELCGAGI